MKAWRTAGLVTHCGGCQRRLEVGELVLIVTLPNVREKKYRCLACAAREFDEDTPPDPGELDCGDLMTSAPAATPPAAETPRRPRRPDWKHLAAGHKEDE